ncbi:MAG: sigma-70 family RNA polymerase sigma factor [Armatimonadetes bacterium]|nr:sigma-70 family RNA polymerase sigma factor [Armatimonadota bacterium]
MMSKRYAGLANHRNACPTRKGDGSMASSDLDLLARYAKAREAEAFAEVVARHRDMVYRTCCRLLGSRPDAEDAAQECFLQLARSAGSVNESVAGWLHRVAVRTSLALRRRDLVRRRAEREAGSVTPDREAGPTWEEIKDEVDQAIDKLPEDLRVPLVLHFLQGTPQTAIAEELGVSQQAVSLRIKKAVERLRRHLGPAGAALSVAGLAALVGSGSAEAAPATLVAGLGRIALAGVPPSPPTAIGTAMIGHAAAMSAGTKTVCVLAVCVAVGAAVQQTTQGRLTLSRSPDGAATAIAQPHRSSMTPELPGLPSARNKVPEGRSSRDEAAASASLTAGRGSPDRARASALRRSQSGPAPAPHPRTRREEAPVPSRPEVPLKKSVPPVRIAQEPGAGMGPEVPAAPPGTRTAHLKGRVLGPDGQPVPGAEVGVTSNSRPLVTPEKIFTGKCADTGEFDLAEEAQDWQQFWTVFARQGTDLMGAATVAKEDEGKPIDVRLQPVGFIHSSVVTPAGTPLPGIATYIRAGRQWPLLLQGPGTDEKGELLAGPLPAGLELGLQVVSEVHHLVPQDVWRDHEITLQPGQTYELPPLTLDPQGRSIEGVLVDGDGKPLPGARVACYLPSWPVNSATADEQGRFELTKLPVAGYDVWLIAADTAKGLYVMAPVDPDAGEKARLVLRPLTSASGFLSGPDGQVLGNVRVQLFSMVRGLQQGITTYMMLNSEWVSRPEPANTTADGEWEIGGLVPGGTYALQPEIPGAYLDFEGGLFEVDREGKPTDLGLMMMR